MSFFDGLRRREARLALVIVSQPTARVAISGAALDPVVERGGENDQQTHPAGHGRRDRTRLRRRRFRTNVSEATDQDHRPRPGPRTCRHRRETDWATALHVAWATGGHR